MEKTITRRIFDSSGCLNLDGLMGLHEKSLEPAETTAAENHVAECFLCEEALSGMGEFGSASEIIDGVSAVTAGIKTGAAASLVAGGTKLYFWIAAAASVALLAVWGSFFYYQQESEKNEELYTQNFDAYPAPDVQDQKQEPKSEPSRQKDQDASDNAPEIAEFNEGKEDFNGIVSGDAEMRFNSNSVTSKMESENIVAQDPVGMVDDFEADEQYAYADEAEEEVDALYAGPEKEKKQLEAAKDKMGTRTDDGSFSQFDVATFGNDNKQPVVTDQNRDFLTNGSSPKLSVAPTAPTYNWSAPAPITTDSTTIAGGAITYNVTPTEDLDDESTFMREEIATGETKSFSKELFRSGKNSKSKRNRSMAAPKTKSNQRTVYTFDGVPGGWTYDSDRSVFVDVETVKQDAMDAYKRKNYSEAVRQFETLLKQEPSLAESRFFCGLSYLELGNPTAAIGHFDFLLRNRDHNYLHQAKWYKSLALIKLNRKKEASAILENVSKENGEFRQKAVELLDDLD